MAEDLGNLVAKLGADVTDLKRGLLEGKAQLAGFQEVVEEAGAKVRQVLAFAGIGVGIYELVSKLKEFGREVLDVGGKNEVLRASMYALGQHYKISGDALDLYINKLTQMGLSQENALQSVNNFLKAGLSVDLLPQLAAAAKDLAPTMAMPFNEAYGAIIQAITKGTPKALAELTPGIKQAMQAASSETKKIMDSTILSGTEKSQIMLDFVLLAAQKVKGAGDAVAGSYLAKLAEFKLAALEAKEALFEFLKPVSAAALGAQVTSWHELNLWVVNNRQSLVQLSQVLVIYIEKGVLSIKMIIDFVAAHKELFKILLEVWGVLKVLKWVTIAEGAATAAIAVGGLIGKLAALRLALAGPWGLVIAVSLVGLYEAAKAIKDTIKKTPSVGTSMLLGEAEGTLSGQQRDDLHARGQAEDEAAAEERAFEQRLKDASAKISEMSPSEQVRKGPAVTEAEARAEAARAKKLAELENALDGKTGKGGGKSAKENADNLLAPFQAMLKAKRDLTLQDAQNYYDVQKTTNEKVRADYELSLAKGEMDGTAYYQKLQDLQQQETAGALDMIAKKKNAQAIAYQEALALIEADTKLSDPAKDIARQKLAADEKKAQAKLNAEARQAELDGEKKVTDELRRQVEVRKQYTQKTEYLNLETSQLLGAISEQEAKLQKLVLDWKQTKKEAIDKGGYTSTYAAALEANLGAKQFEVKYGTMMSSISGEFSAGVTNIINGIRKGTLDIGTTLADMFNNIMMATLKPGFDALGEALTRAVKSLLNSLSSSLGGGNLFGGGSGTSGYDYQPGGYGFLNWSAHGNVFSHGIRQAFGGGGIVTRPTLFPMATGQGLMGEEGEEGILPLSRIGGDLGVKALLPKPGPVQVNIINKTGTEAAGSAQQNDDGSLDILLEKKVLGYVSRGPVHNLIKVLK